MSRTGQATAEPSSAPGSARDRTRRAEGEVRREAPLFERKAPRPELVREPGLQARELRAVRRGEPPDVAALAPEAPRALKAEREGLRPCRGGEHGGAGVGEPRLRLFAEEGEGEVEVFAPRIIGAPGPFPEPVPRRLKCVQFVFSEIYRNKEPHLHHRPQYTTKTPPEGGVLEFIRGTSRTTPHTAGRDFKPAPPPVWRRLRRRPRGKGRGRRGGQKALRRSRVYNGSGAQRCRRAPTSPSRACSQA